MNFLMTTRAMATGKRFSIFKGLKWHLYDADSLIITEFTDTTKTSHIYWNLRPFIPQCQLPDDMEVYAREKGFFTITAIIRPSSSVKFHRI